MAGPFSLATGRQPNAVSNSPGRAIFTALSILEAESDFKLLIDDSQTLNSFA